MAITPDTINNTSLKPNRRWCTSNALQSAIAAAGVGFAVPAVLVAQQPFAVAHA